MMNAPSGVEANRVVAFAKAVRLGARVTRSSGFDSEFECLVFAVITNRETSLAPIAVAFRPRNNITHGPFTRSTAFLKPRDAHYASGVPNIMTLYLCDWGQLSDQFVPE